MAFVSPLRGVQVVRRRVATAIGSFPSRSFYVDATLGNDANNGIYPNAWQTVAKVSGETFLPGDRILFKRGETWQDYLQPSSSGIAGNPIVFGAYGSGARPIIDGDEWDSAFRTGGESYIRVQDIHLTVEQTPATWACVMTEGASTGIRIVNCEVSGDQVLIGDGTSYNVVRRCLVHDIRSDGIVLEGPNNLAEYNTIYNTGLNVDDTSGITIHQVAAVNCIAQYNTIYDLVTTDNLRGIIVDNVPNSNAVVMFNVVYNVPSGISAYGTTTNALAAYNIVYDSSRKADDFWGRGLESSDATAAANNIFYNNVVYDAGNAIFCWDGHTCTFKNNILLNNRRQIRMLNDFFATHTLDNNIYFGGTATWVWGVGKNWADYRTDSGQDANGLNQDPVLVNPGIEDFHLQAASPCRDAGVDVGLTRDKDGVPVPQETNPAMGAYEFVP